MQKRLRQARFLALKIPQAVEKSKPFHTVDGNAKGVAIMENSIDVPQKIKKQNCHMIQ